MITVFLKFGFDFMKLLGFLIGDTVTHLHSEACEMRDLLVFVLIFGCVSGEVVFILVVVMTYNNSFSKEKSKKVKRYTCSGFLLRSRHDEVWENNVLERRCPVPQFGKNKLRLFFRMCMFASTVNHVL